MSPRGGRKKTSKSVSSTTTQNKKDISSHEREGVLMKNPKDQINVTLHSVEDVVDDESVNVVVDDLIEEELAEEVVTGQIDTEDFSGLPPGFHVQPVGLKPFQFDVLTDIQNAHDKVASIIREGSSLLPKAFWSNLARDRQNLKDGVAGTIIGGAFALLAGDPMFFIIAAPIGFFVRNVWNTARIRSKKEKLSRRDVRDMESSNLPELKSAWDLTCWKFVRLIRGYNERVSAVNRIRGNRLRENGKDLLDIADKWSSLLKEVFERLENVCAELQRHQSLLISQFSDDLEELDDSLRHQDLLGYFDGVPLLDWLDLGGLSIKTNRILLSQVRYVFRADMEARAELQDQNKRRKEAVCDIDAFLDQTDPIFDDLEKEHAEAVDALQADEDKDIDS